jgi:hypothetical protein
MTNIGFLRKRMKIVVHLLLARGSHRTAWSEKEKLVEGTTCKDAS